MAFTCLPPTRSLRFCVRRCDANHLKEACLQKLGMVEEELEKRFSDGEVKKLAEDLEKKSAPR